MSEWRLNAVSATKAIFTARVSEHVRTSNYQTFKLSIQTIKQKHFRASNYSTFKLSNKNSQTFKQLIKVYTAQLLSKNLRSLLFLTALSLCHFLPSFWNNSATVREGVTKFEMPQQKLLKKCLFLFIAPFDL